MTGSSSPRSTRARSWSCGDLLGDAVELVGLTEPAPYEPGSGDRRDVRAERPGQGGRSGRADRAAGGGRRQRPGGRRPERHARRPVGPLGRASTAQDRANLDLLLAQLRRRAGRAAGRRLRLRGRLRPARRSQRGRAGRGAGLVLREPRGSGGFGYDPVLRARRARPTTAELAPSREGRRSATGARRSGCSRRGSGGARVTSLTGGRRACRRRHRAAVRRARGPRRGQELPPLAGRPGAAVPGRRPARGRQRARPLRRRLGRGRRRPAGRPARPTRAGCAGLRERFAGDPVVRVRELAVPIDETVVALGRRRLQRARAHPRRRRGAAAPSPGCCAPAARSCWSCRPSRAR